MGNRILHLDAFSGAAGNMFLGAMLDLGLDRASLLDGLAPLGLEFDLVVQEVDRAGFAACYVDVEIPRSPANHAHEEPHRHAGSHDHGRRYAEICALIERAPLEPTIADRALAIFGALGRAEAKVHGVSIDDVHFHEVGAVDAIVDIVGAAVALARLDIDRVTCSPIAVGHGTIESDHGRLPLPAPATLELLVGLPTVPANVAWETLTPTGAAILATVVDEFCALPAMTVRRVGHGAGNDRPGPMPNLLRATLGESEQILRDRVVCLETNLDDLVPEHFDYLMERLFEAGALDVSLQHLQMKKNRPGFLVRVLARPVERDALARILFAESTAIGVRVSEWDRLVLERERLPLETPLGTAWVKRIRSPEGAIVYSPEYDDCKRLAREHGLALREVVRRITDWARAELGE